MPLTALAALIVVTDDEEGRSSPKKFGSFAAWREQLDGEDACTRVSGRLARRSWHQRAGAVAGWVVAAWAVSCSPADAVSYRLTSEFRMRLS